MKNIELCAIGNENSISGGFLYHKWLARNQDQIELKFFLEEEDLVDFLADSKNVLLIDAWALHEISIDQLPMNFYLLVHHPIALDKQVIGDELKEEAIWNLAKGIIVTGKEVFEYITTRTNTPVLLLEPGISQVKEYQNVKLEGGRNLTNLIALGSVIPRKGDELLFKALEKVGEGFVLHRMGPTPEKQYFFDIKYMVEKSGMENKVKWWINSTEEEKMGLLARANLALFPTNYESYGMAIQECLSLGIPVFCSDLPALKQRFGEKGIRYLALDAKVWHNEIEKFLSDPNFVKQMKEESKNNRINFPTWEQQATLLRQFINQEENK